MKVIRFRIKYLKIKNIIIAIFPIITLLLALFIYNLTIPKLHYSMDYKTALNIKTYPVSFYSKDNSIYALYSDNTTPKICQDAPKASNFHTSNNPNNYSLNFSYQYINATTFLYTISDFSNNGATLYKYDLEKGSTEIDTDVDNNITSFGGKKGAMLYAKASTTNPNYGTLYLYQNNKISKISSDDCKLHEYSFSSDGSTIAYIETDLKTLTDSIYEKKINGKPILIARNTKLNIVAMSSEGSAIFYTQGATNDSNAVVPLALYSKIIGKPSELVTTKVGEYIIVPKDMSVYYIGDYSASKKIGSLYYKELNKKSIKIDHNVYNFQNATIISNKITDYYETINNKEIYYMKKGIDGKTKINYSRNLSTPYELLSTISSGNYPYIVKNTDDNSLSIISDNISKITIDKLFLDNKKPKVKTVFDGERSYAGYSDGLDYYKNIFFSTRASNKINLNCYSEVDNKTKFLVSTASDINFFILDKDTLYYMVNEEFWVKEPNKDAVKISNAVKFFKSNNKLYFYKKTSDFNKYEFYSYSLGKDPELIASGIDAFQ